MSETTTPRRDYALMKIEAGDYLLPGNDKTTLWRIRKCEALHIAANGIDEVARPVWDLYRWQYPLTNEGALQWLDTSDWSEWEYLEYGVTRAEAVERAMELEAEGGPR